MKVILCKSFLISILIGLPACAQDLSLSRTPGADPGPGTPACQEGNGWYSLFDGTGTSITNYFFNPSGQRHGDNSRWWVVGGVLYSDQSSDRKGGCIMSKRQYRNAEVKILTKPYWGNDGGIFFRSNTYGRAYQVVVDYHVGATSAVGGVWGEGRPAGQGINYKPFGFVTQTNITLRAEWYSNGTAGRPRLTAEDWAARIWKVNDFNWVHGKIYHDDVPFIDTWVNQEFQMVHYEDPASLAANEAKTGHLALQVHQGNTAWMINNPNLYKTILVREIQGSGAPLAAYEGWCGACPNSPGCGVATRPDPPAAPSLSWRLTGKALAVTVASDRDYVLTLSDLRGRRVSRLPGKAGARAHRMQVPRAAMHLLEIRAPGYRRSYKVFPGKE